MGNLQTIVIGTNEAGIQITYMKTRNTISPSGWYDHGPGKNIGGTEMPLTRIWNEDKIEGIATGANQPDQDIKKEEGVK